MNMLINGAGGVTSKGIDGLNTSTNAGYVRNADGTLVEGRDTFGNRFGRPADTGTPAYGVSNPLPNGYTASAQELMNRWKMGGRISPEERERIRQYLMRQQGVYIGDGLNDEAFNQALAAYNSGAKQTAAAATASSAPTTVVSSTTPKSQYKKATGGGYIDRTTGKKVSSI